MFFDKFSNSSEFFFKKNSANQIDLSDEMQREPNQMSHEKIVYYVSNYISIFAADNLSCSLLSLLNCAMSTI